MRFIAILLLGLICASGNGEWNLKKVWESGGADESGVWYGLIIDAAPLPDGRVVVLDQANQQVVLLDRTGFVESRLGKSGRGPGEFEAPVDLEVDGPTAILAMDALIGRLSRLADSAGTLVHKESWLPPLNLISFCTLGNRLFGLGVGSDALQPGIVLHELKWGGAAPVRSFGVQQKDVGRPQIAFREGRLLCVDRAGLLLFLPDFYPEVHAFNSDGEHLWTTVLPNYKPVTIEGGPGWVRYTAEDGSHDTGAQLAVLSNGILVQWARVKRGVSREETPRVSSALLSLTDGALLEFRSDVPRIATAGLGGIVGFQNVPFPKVVMYREEGS